jgi:hypothetical protein
VCQNAELNAALGKINKAAFKGRLTGDPVQVILFL